MSEHKSPKKFRDSDHLELCNIVGAICVCAAAIPSVFWADDLAAKNLPDITRVQHFTIDAAGFIAGVVAGFVLFGIAMYCIEHSYNAYQDYREGQVHAPPRIS